MKKPIWLATLALSALGVLLAAEEQDIESMPPVVVKAVPESGARDVTPGTVEIKVTFSKEMADNSWSWSTAWQGSTPESVGKPRYEADRKTCVLKVKLEPNKTYAYWLNSEKFKNFKDRQGHSAVPYLLVFQTKDKWDGGFRLGLWFLTGIEPPEIDPRRRPAGRHLRHNALDGGASFA